MGAGCLSRPPNPAKDCRIWSNKKGVKANDSSRFSLQLPIMRVFTQADQEGRSDAATGSLLRHDANLLRE